MVFVEGIGLALEVFRLDGGIDGQFGCGYSLSSERGRGNAASQSARTPD